MIDTKALREKVLDLAIRGKLVPQDPNDEPASVLLERIRAEKEQMVKDGKLKAKDIKNDTIIFKGDDNLHYEHFPDGTAKCIEEEIPFELPEGWIWTRLGATFSTVTGSTPSTKDASLYGDEYPFYKPTDLDAGFDVLSSEDSVSEKGYLSGRILPADSVLVTCIGATIGKTGYIKASGICNQQINAILPNAYISSEYIYFCMCSKFEQQQIWTRSSATTLPILNKSKFDNLLIPIPSKEQQRMIVCKIKEFLRFIEIIQTEKTTLQDTIKALKSKILDLAIRGQLVPQNPDDEPASVLLERIRAEKEELVKAGKIKRDKKESVIFKGEDNSYYEKIDGEIIDITEEIPFSIPENWCWCRLNTLCTKEIKRGKAPKYSEKSNTLVFAQKCNTKKGSINISLAQYLDENVLKKYSPEFFMKYNDIVINSTGTGTLGRVGIFEKSDDIYGLPLVPDSHITTIRVSKLISAKYIYALLKFKQPYLETAGEGSTNQKELRPDVLSNILIPLPPVLEQKQIVATINSINIKLDEIEQSLN